MLKSASMFPRFLFLALALASVAAAQNVVLKNVTLIDGTGAPPVPNATNVVQGGGIREIGPSATTGAPDGVEALDLSGKFVVPGIINLHGHVGNVKGVAQSREFFTRENVIKNLRAYALYGVTSTTSMGTDEDLMADLRDERNRGGFESARVLTALQGFTARAGYPTTAPGVKGVAQEVSTAAQARVWVDKLVDKRPDLVKMWVDSHHGDFEKLSPAIYSAIIKQAHKRGMIAFAHVYELSDAKALVKAGVDILGHSVRDAEVDDEFIQMMKKNNVFYAPTIMREVSTYVYADPPGWLDDPFFKQGTDPETIAAVRTTLRAAQSKPEIIEQGKSDEEMAMRNAKKLVDAGVNVAFGTDTGPPGRFAGFFEHLEAERMVAAGISPLRVIQGWSDYASRALRIDKKFGTVAEGKAADLLVLDADPLADIRNTRKIHAVYIGGKKFE